MPGFITITHPGIEGVADIHPDALDHYRAKGWRPLAEALADTSTDDATGDENADPTTTADDTAPVTEES